MEKFNEETNEKIKQLQESVATLTAKNRLLGDKNNKYKMALKTIYSESLTKLSTLNISFDGQGSNKKKRANQVRITMPELDTDSSPNSDDDDDTNVPIALTQKIVLPEPRCSSRKTSTNCITALPIDETNHSYKQKTYSDVDEIEFHIGIKLPTGTKKRPWKDKFLKIEKGQLSIHETDGADEVLASINLSSKAGFSFRSDLKPADIPKTFQTNLIKN
ncbi:hypothetical protein HCN44_002816 [Aphidius gifuensis]|uniref:Uncharacterized protein n=1 Tax=Aphidius gifuensis TaxID=684658 RepID=A0A834XU31_APHGI|nr:hypothetical protein HCN44_002816 [Aphidius gifuensis]